MRLFEFFNGINKPPGNDREPGESMAEVLADLLLQVSNNIQSSAAEYDDDEEYKQQLEERAMYLLSLSTIFDLDGMNAGLNALYNKYLSIADYAEEVARDHMNINLHDMYNNTLSEAKTDKKKVPATTPRNFVAKAVTRKTGGGPHSENKFTRKEKHKKPESGQ